MSRDPYPKCATPGCGSEVEYAIHGFICEACFNALPRPERRRRERESMKAIERVVRELNKRRGKETA